MQSYAETNGMLIQEWERLRTGWLIVRARLEPAAVGNVPAATVTSWSANAANKNLVPLSRQHQHVLALCVRIDRALPMAESSLSAWQAEIAQHFRTEIRIHFAAEEEFVFPAARVFPELNALVDDLISDHAWL